MKMLFHTGQSIFAFLGCWLFSTTALSYLLCRRGTRERHYEVSHLVSCFGECLCWSILVAMLVCLLLTLSFEKREREERLWTN